MKHKILSLTVCLLLSILPSWSQDNNNTPLSYRPTFNFYGIDSNGHPVCPSISPAGTKEINGHLFQTYVFGQEETERTFYIREEGNKIFRFFEDEQVEKIIIDFDSRVGDIFTKADGSQLTVTAVRDTTLWNNQHKMICLSEDGNTEADVWIENIGSVLTGFFLPDDLPGITLKRVIFSTTAIPGNSQCWLTTRMNLDNLKTDFTVEADEKTGDASKPLTYEFEDGNLIVKGAVTKTISNFHQYTCIIHDSDIYFSIDDGGALRHGTKNLSVDLRFMNITPGTYNIHYGTWMRGTEFEDLQAPQTVECKVQDNRNPIFGGTWAFNAYDESGKSCWINMMQTNRTKNFEGKTFSEVYRRSIYPTTPQLGYDPVVYFRQEGTKVYRYDEEKETEVLVVDYSMETGDEFVNPDGIHMRVIEVRDTVLSESNPTSSKIYELRSVDDPIITDVWIEGLGSINTGLLRTQEDCYTITHLMCGGCGKGVYWPDINEDRFKSKQVQTTADDVLKDGQKGYAMECEFIGNTLHVSGSAPLYYNIPFTRPFAHSATCAVTDNNEIYFFIDDYLYNSMEGDKIWQHYDVEFTGFKPGTYTIHYGWEASGPLYNHLSKTITCEGGNSQPGETAVSTPEASDTSTAPRSAELRAEALFDLSGRRITGNPGRGVYIQGKKKVVINDCRVQ